MSFKKIEDYLDKIEAIQNYDKVVNDNNELFRTGNQRATDLNNCHRRVRELEQVRITYNGNEYSLEEF